MRNRDRNEELRTRERSKTKIPQWFNQVKKMRKKVTINNLISKKKILR